jgi:hypothetical protein
MSANVSGKMAMDKLSKEMFADWGQKADEKARCEHVAPALKNSYETMPTRTVTVWNSFSEKPALGPFAPGHNHLLAEQNMLIWYNSR